jgi:hypothetical protein
MPTYSQKLVHNRYCPAPRELPLLRGLVPKHDSTSSTPDNQLSQNANHLSDTPNIYNTCLSVLPEHSSESAPDEHLLIHGNAKTPPIARAE